MQTARNLLRRLPLLLLTTLPLQSCGEAPSTDQVCGQVSGGCLALSVNGSGSFSQLVVRATLAGGLTPMPVAKGGQSATLPVYIALTPPPQVKPSQIQRLDVDALDGAGAVLRSGSTSVSWADGTNSAATVNLEAPGSGTSPGPSKLPVSLTTGDDLYAVGDFDGDGRLDFAALVPAQKSVVSFLNNGQGGFTKSSGTTLPFGGQSLVAADVNGDRRADLIVADSSSFVVALASGGGGFTVLGETTGGSSLRIAVGDFVGDSNLDLIVGDSTRSLTPWLGNGSGGFTSQTSASVRVTQSDIQAVAAIDVVGSKQGVAIVSRTPPTLAVYAAAPGPALSQQATLSLSSAPGQLTAADFDGDGRPDLISLASYSNVQIFPNKGGGMFGSPWTFATESSLSRYRAAVIDFDRDGKPELALGQGGSTRLLVRGSTSALTELASSLSEGPPIAALDTNQDGKLDLVLHDTALRLVVYK